MLRVTRCACTVHQTAELLEADLRAELSLEHIWTVAAQEEGQ
jgi:hypothetical protein